MRTSKSIEGITQENVERIAQMESASINRRTTGELVADIAAKWVGSWPFLIVQTVLLVTWLTLNAIEAHSWDPYPFVLLNLLLSFEAAYATPIILMSENRQARLSERRNQLDLQINLLTEQENTEQLKLLRMICEKLNIPLSKEQQSAYEQALKPEVIIQQIVSNADTDETDGQPSQGR